jgi:hypothetical protein
VRRREEEGGGLSCSEAATVDWIVEAPVLGHARSGAKSPVVCGNGAARGIPLLAGGWLAGMVVLLLAPTALRLRSLAVLVVDARCTRLLAGAVCTSPKLEKGMFHVKHSPPPPPLDHRKLCSPADHPDWFSLLSWGTQQLFAIITRRAIVAT